MNSKKPSTVWLTLNRKCNNNCSWCYAQRAEKEEMDFKKAKMCIGNLAALGIKNIVLIGGEPTIYPQIIEIIQYIRDLGLKVSVVSNGRKFSNKDFTKQCLNAGISGIDISLKALTPQEYIENTRADGFEQCISGYKNLVEWGFRPTISYVICKHDTSDIEKLKDLLIEKDLDDITIQFVKPELSEKANNVIMPLYQMGEMVSEIYQVFKTCNKHYRVEISFPLCLINQEILNILIKEKRVLTCCHVQKGSGLVIDPNFRILPCNHFIDMPYDKKSIGLAEKEEILEFWNSEPVEQLRRKTRYYPSSKCMNCKLWDICGGGCFTRWLFESPDMYIKKAIV